MSDVLSENTLSLISDSISLAKMLGIEGIIADGDGIRGINSQEGIMIAAMGDFNFEFDNLGLERLDQLKSKFSLLDKVSDLKASFMQKPNKDHVSSLTFKSKKIKFDFRCTSPEHINDIPSKNFKQKAIYSFDVTKEEVADIKRSYNAMKVAFIKLHSDGDKAILEFTDDIKDSLTYEFDSKVKTDEDQPFEIILNIKKLLPVLSYLATDDVFTINFITDNIIQMKKGNINLFLIGEVEYDE